MWVQGSKSFRSLGVGVFDLDFLLRVLSFVMRNFVILDGSGESGIVASEIHIKVAVALGGDD
jgi:hypothetical protein